MRFLILKISIFTIGATCCIVHSLYAQIQVVPIQKELKKSISNISGRNLEDGPELPLTLPFWDDFSTSTGGPDPQLWEQGSGVTISDGMGIAPPTVNVATFDGWDANGVPYSNHNMASGPADSLVSKKIDLSTVAPEKRHTLFFSFFWQLKGNGEMPDKEDYIRLQFWTPHKRWATAWQVPLPGQNIESIDPTSFQQEIIRIADSLCHDNFKFRFQSFNRLSGSFDTWNIDYIYLNQDRHAGNTAYFDRALTSLPSSIFNEYHAVPFDQFLKKPEYYCGNTSVGFYNLDDVLQPIDYFFQLRDARNQQVIEIVNNNTEMSPPPLGLERRSVQSANISKDLLVEYATNMDKKEGLEIEARFFINSGDGYLVSNGQTFSQVNFRVNDTVSRNFVIKDYFAYDDGGAEYGAGINQRGGQLAYQFILQEQDTLTHFDVHFPIIGQSQTGSSVILKVWKKLDNEYEDLLHNQMDIVRQSEALNGFTRYALNTPLIVSDTIYIGWEQMANDFLAVGLDKNTDTGEKIWYNVGNTWRQNSSISGSLMLRPVFERGNELVTHLPQAPEKEKVVVYPNPSKDSLYLKGDFEKIRVYDSRGSLIKEVENLLQENNFHLDIANYQPGIYLLHIFDKNSVQLEKVFLNK